MRTRPFARLLTLALLAAAGAPLAAEAQLASRGAHAAAARLRLTGSGQRPGGRPASSATAVGKGALAGTGDDRRRDSPRRVRA